MVKKTSFVAGIEPTEVLKPSSLKLNNVFSVYGSFTDQKQAHTSSAHLFCTLSKLVFCNSVQKIEIWVRLR